MRTIFLLVALAGQLHFGFSQAPKYECTLERLDGGEEFCVFRDVHQPAAGATFGSPSGAAKPSRIAFRGGCTMEHIPREFLQQFSTDLRVLYVEGCQLKSVTVTNGLEVLRAGNNTIARVVVHQSGEQSVLRELDLSQNKIGDIKNITRCQNLEVLNLSGNNGILHPDRGQTLEVLELSDFGGLGKLKELYLSNLGANYLDNTKNIALDSLVLLDLSHNNLIPSDLRIQKLYSFKSLETLRLNDNNMANIEYNLLLSIKSLKTVYLNGNGFQCTYVKPMLDHLNSNGLQTPTETENYDCRSQQNKFLDMCCVGFVPQPPPPPPGNSTTSTSTTTSTPVTPTVKPAGTDEKVQPVAEKDNLPWIIGVIVGVLLVVAGAVAGFLVYKKKQTAAANIGGESSVALRRE